MWWDHALSVHVDFAIGGRGVIDGQSRLARAGCCGFNCLAYNTIGSSGSGLCTEPEPEARLSQLRRSAHPSPPESTSPASPRSPPRPRVALASEAKPAGRRVAASGPLARLDTTVDPTHGSQQSTFFNGFYDTSCYLPLAAFLAFDDEVKQYLFCYVLRPGNAVAKRGCVAVLNRLLPPLRRAFPGALLDGGFSGSELFAFFEAERLEYVVGMPKNPTLKCLAEPLLAPIT